MCSRAWLERIVFGQEHHTGVEAYPVLAAGEARLSVSR